MNVLTVGSGRRLAGNEFPDPTVRMVSWYAPLAEVRMRARRFRCFALAVMAAVPAAAQERSLVARFSETRWHEPTFVVSRAAYVGVFELLGGTRVVQLYPRGEAAAATALPAGETPLAMLDVNIGRVTGAPGVRTVFWQNGSYDQRQAPSSGVTEARTLLLIASDQPLAVGLPSEFRARFPRALAAIDSALPPQVRAVQATMAAVYPALATADLASDLQTMWLASSPAFHGSVASIGANDPYDNGLGCDAIRPYGYAAVTTYSSMIGCPEPYIPLWGYGWWIPGIPVYFPVTPRAVPNGPTIGVFPVSPTSSRVRHVADKAPIEQVPALTSSAFSAPSGSVSNIAGGGRIETVPAVAAYPMAAPGGRGGGALHAVGERAQIHEDVPSYARPAGAPSSRGAGPGTHEGGVGQRPVSAPAPVFVAAAHDSPAPVRAAASPTHSPSSGGGREQSHSSQKPRAHQ